MVAPRCEQRADGAFPFGNCPAWERRGPIGSGTNRSSPPAVASGGRPTPASRRGLNLAELRVIDIREDWNRTILAFFVRPVQLGNRFPAWPCRMVRRTR